MSSNEENNQNKNDGWIYDQEKSVISQDAKANDSCQLEVDRDVVIENVVGQYRSTLDSAVTAADYIKAFHYPIHRGVFEIDLGFIVFGNDGYTGDNRTKREVQIVRERLKALGLPEPEFGVDSSEGWTWALVFFPVKAFHASPPEFRRLIEAANEIVWESWGVSFDDAQVSDGGEQPTDAGKSEQ